MIVVPMAGLSSRFFSEGYEVPKFMLDLNGLSLFRHSLLSFKHYFSSEEFLFIVLDRLGFYDFVIGEIRELGIESYQIILLDSPTKGQAETVYLGLQEYKGIIDSFSIFNIDTFRPDFKFPEFSQNVDGYLEVFEGEGDNWSFIKLDNRDSYRVTETAEKSPISNLCCTGLYWFKHSAMFFDAFTYYKKNEIFTRGELYVAPLYNYLIEKGYYISYNLIKLEDVKFCGTPEEYRSLQRTYDKF